MKEVFLLAKGMKAKKVKLADGLPKLFKLAAEDRPLNEIAQVLKAVLEVLVLPECKRLANYRSQVRVFTQLLCQLIENGETQVQVFALRFGVQGLKFLTEKDDFPHEMFKEFVHATLSAKNWATQLADCLVVELCVPFRDLRTHLARFVETGLESYNKQNVEALTLTGKKRKRRGTTLSVQGEELGLRTRDLLLRFPDVNDWMECQNCFVIESAMNLDQGSAIKKYRAAFVSCWQRFLQLPMGTDVTMSVLQHMPSNVLPHMGNPLACANFYITAFDRGSLAVSVLALSGLFYLLTKHDLGDTDKVGQHANQYYHKLYELLCPEVFALRHRVRFLRLLQLSLKSTMLPSSYVAAFVKKSARVASLVPSPPAALWLLVNMQGLMQRHQALCAPMLHRDVDNTMTFGKSPAAVGSTDPFDVTVPLTVASKKDMALTTSLWEIELLQDHYCPQVARMARMFFTPKFLQRQKPMDPEEYLDLSFDKLFTREFNHSRKKHKSDKTEDEQKAAEKNVLPPAVAFQSGTRYWDVLADLAFIRPELANDLKFEVSHQTKS